MTESRYDKKRCVVVQEIPDYSAIFVIKSFFGKKRRDYIIIFQKKTKKTRRGLLNFPIFYPMI